MTARELIPRLPALRLRDERGELTAECRKLVACFIREGLVRELADGELEITDQDVREFALAFRMEFDA